MKQEISALMDSELLEDEIESLFGRAHRFANVHRDWEIYHLIGDVLRQPEHIHNDLSVKVRERIQDEPTVLVPRGHTVIRKARTFALSVAASLVAVGVVAWMSQQIGYEPLPRMAMQQNTLRPVSTQIQSKSNDYLMAHQEFSPSAEMNGGASYIRIVSYDQEGR